MHPMGGIVHELSFDFHRKICLCTAYYIAKNAYETHDVRINTYCNSKGEMWYSFASKSSGLRLSHKRKLALLCVTYVRSSTRGIIIILNMCYVQYIVLMFVCV